MIGFIGTPTYQIERWLKIQRSTQKYLDRPTLVPSRLRQNCTKNTKLVHFETNRDPIWFDFSEECFINAFLKTQKIVDKNEAYIFCTYNKSTQVFCTTIKPNKMSLIAGKCSQPSDCSIVNFVHLIISLYHNK